MSRAHPEQVLHIAVARFLDLALPAPAWWTTIPAGGGGEVRGAKLKAMGYRPGTPDILIIHRYDVIWIELKSPKGRLAEFQRKCHTDLLKNGCCHWALARSVDDVQQALEDLGIPLKAQVA